MNKVGTLSLAALWLLGCNANPDPDHGGHSHQSESVKRTVWNDSLEAYVEYEALTIERVSQFAIHLTRLADQKPWAESAVRASLVHGSDGIANPAEMVSPGIFITRLKPGNPGYHKLILTLKREIEPMEIVLDSLYVYKADESLSSAEAIGESILFTKEQSWEMDFRVDPVKYQNYSSVISASGMILPASENEIAITTNSAGIVHYRNLKLVMGQEIREGEWLATVKGDKILGGVDAEENLAASYAIAKAELGQSEASFERHKELFEAKIISRSDFEMAEREYHVARAEFEAIANDYFEGGKKVIALRNGYIKKILVEPGEYVRVGTSLLVLSQNRSLRIRMDLPQKYFSQIEQITSLNFRISSIDRFFSLEELHGRMVSYGRNLEETGPLIPVYFEVSNNGQLVSGAMVEGYLKLATAQHKLTIPNEAIMEDYGRLTVFVQIQGEEYEQREIQVGQSDGKVTVVNSGLKKGDRVVTRGAYQIKMASVSESIGHGHTH